MKRVLCAFVMLLALQMGFCATDSYDNGEYIYYLTDNGEISITRCKLDQDIIEVPSSLSIGNTAYPVTTIEQLISGGKRDKTRILHIPASVTTLSPNNYRITKSTTSLDVALKSIILENGNFSLTNESAPFSIPIANDSQLDNIIVFGTCRYSSKELTGQETDHVFKAGLIKILLNDASSFFIQMYLCDSRGDYGSGKFESKRFEYLETALRIHGTNINDIRIIDLSGIPTPDNPINFNCETHSDLFPNATIVTTKEQIADKVDYTSPDSDFNGLISYQRTNTQYWNSVCLPFAIKESDFPEGTSIYCLESIANNKVYLKRIGAEESVSAGVPCYIYCENDTPWDLQIYGTIAKDQAPVDQESNGWKLVGSFVNQSLGTGKYKLNSTGDAFVTTTQSSTVTAFRCYLAPVNSSTAPARLEVGVDEEAEITLVPDDREPQRMKLYDLMGRPRRENAPGLFIRGK